MDGGSNELKKGKGKGKGKGVRKKGGGDGSGEWPHVSCKPDLTVIPLKANLLFTVPNFLTSFESKRFIDAAESLGFAHQGSLGPTRGEAFRDNDRISVNHPVLAEDIWESGLKKIFADVQVQKRSAVGLNPNIRFYRYQVGQRFGRHIDESVELGNNRCTQYTLLIYLTGGGRNDNTSLVGGETVFYDNRGRVVAKVAPIEGMALLHLHGHQCMLHEARAVRKNVKYILRSDVIFSY